MLSKNKVFDNQIIILITTTEEGRTKDGKIINKEGIKDAQIIEGIDKIEMANLAKNAYNQNNDNLNNGNWQGGDMKCFYYRKERHQKNDRPLWK
jgi:hypothetical protein